MHQTGKPPVDATFKRSPVKQIQKILEAHRHQMLIEHEKKKSMDVYRSGITDMSGTKRHSSLFWTANNKVRSMSHSLHIVQLLFRVPPANLEIPSSAYSIYIQSTSPFSYWIRCYEPQFFLYCLEVSFDSVCRMWKIRYSCQHAAAPQFKSEHDMPACVSPPAKEAQSKETTSQQKMKGCHHEVLSSWLGPVVLNENRPAWPGSTYLFLQMCNFSH